MLQRKCEQYWSDNIGDVYETPDKKMQITTTSSVPFADFEIRNFNVKKVRQSACICYTQYSVLVYVQLVLV